jgi:hypothetical protein
MVDGFGALGKLLFLIPQHPQRKRVNFMGFGRTQQLTGRLPRAHPCYVPGSQGLELFHERQMTASFEDCQLRFLHPSGDRLGGFYRAGSIVPSCKYQHRLSNAAQSGFSVEPAICLVREIRSMAGAYDLPLSPEYPPSTLSPERQRRRLLATLVEWVLGSARAQPLIIATEDLHWVDPSTLELIQLLVEQGATARLLLLYMAYPGFHAPWGASHADQS